MLQVAIDAGPLHGHRTGIGNAVEWYLGALASSTTTSDVSVTRYVTSARARLDPDEIRLPLPAAAALRWWSRSSWPPVDRRLGRPDVIHGTNYVVPPARTPRLVSVYDCWFLEHPGEAHPDVGLASAVLRRALGDGAVAMVSSQATADRLRQHISLDDDQLEVVHLGPPPTTDGEGRPDETLASRLGTDPFVLSLGTVERRKNVPTLIRAFDRLAAEHPTIRLVVAGADGDDAEAVDEAIRVTPERVRDRIVRAGRVDAATKSWLLRRAATLAYPSLDEGFGFPVLEAQAVGTPVAASTAGSIPEVAGSGALFSAPDDADALAVNLYGLIHGGRRDAVIEAGRRNLERFSWSDCVEQTVAIYRRVADPSADRPPRRGSRIPGPTPRSTPGPTP